MHVLVRALVILLSPFRLVGLCAARILNGGVAMRQPLSSIVTDDQ